MLNYNLNINSPLLQEKKNSDVNPPIYWKFESNAVTSDSSDVNELGFATMSINAINSNCIQVSNDANGFFITDEQFPVTASLTGSNWPITGSTTMSLYTAGITYDPASQNQFYFAAVSASASDIQTNPSVTGSRITNSFSASAFFRFFVEGTITHRKGNIFNPLVNVLVTGSKNQYGTTNNSTFNLVKDRNVNLVSVNPITSSFTTQLQYQYALNMTASLTSSNMERSASFIFPTASIVIPELGINVVSYSTSSIISASFVATSNTTLNITGSVEARYIPAFSASALIVGGGAGVAALTGSIARGGGGAGFLWTGSFNVVPNQTYQVFVAQTASIGLGGNESKLVGFDDSFDIPITIVSKGGTTDSLDISGNFYNGGHQGSGSFTRGTTTTNYTPRMGGSGSRVIFGGFPQVAGGGGAGARGNGYDATPGVLGVGQFGGLGGPAFDVLESIDWSLSQPVAAGGTGQSVVTYTFQPIISGSIFGNGGSIQAQTGSFGGAIIKYYGKPKLNITNGRTIDDSDIISGSGFTYHIFNIGTGSFTYIAEPQLNPAPLQ